MKITDLMYYGRYYRDDDESQPAWWYAPDEDLVYQYDDLLKNFGYSSIDDIISSAIFIPLFRTDIISLEHEFIREMNNKKITTYFENISGSDFGREFNIFIEEHFLSNSWHNFERKRLYNDALKWCRENHISSIEIS
ncbi:MAG: UPF0158 family protein [Faecalibacterium sp.]|nr:UPF0158 family protein [Faecalibacterium sp.]